MALVVSATLERITSKDLSLDGLRTLIELLANEVYHYVENALHVLMPHGVEPVWILHTKSKVVLVHNSIFGFHIERLLHVAHDLFKVKGFFFLFICSFCDFVFVLVFFIHRRLRYFLNFKFEASLILSVQYSLVKSWWRCNLAYSCPSCVLFPKNRHEGIGSDVKTSSFFLCKFLKSIVGTFVPLYLIPVSKIFFVWELQIIEEWSGLQIITCLICIGDIETIKLWEFFHFSFDLIENMLMSRALVREFNA